ncbi:MAG: insulinase family protein [Paludibacteraceae bacterium]|nr:insulinase family protein [Paludibacteraceae bacterium]
MRHFLTFLTLFLLSLSASSQLHPIPMDPHVRYGRLDNGLTYYIRHNPLPAQRAHFYIVQNVGAILEQDSQNGLAHFLEHMAFNGTKNFPDKGIIDYMQSVGAKFGVNLNAYTSLDETVYTLKNIPLPRPGVVDSALLILHDQSSFILLLDHEIDKERGVIREEWRQGATANRRLWAKGNRLKYPGSQYARRDVIGDTAVINNFPYDTLRAYYRKWYRPDLQAIVVVGDVNADSVERSLQRIFSDIPAPVNPAERIFYQVPDNQSPILSVVTDPEAKNTTLGLEFKKQPQSRTFKNSEEGYVQVLADQLISLMFAERLSVISSRPDASFVDSYVYYGNVIRPCDAFLVGVVPKEHMESKAWNDLISETERLRRYGFLPTELLRAQKRLLASLEKSYNERDKQKSSHYVQEYVNHFLLGEPTPGIEWEFPFASRACASRISIDSVNRRVADLITTHNLIIDVSAPDKAAPDLPSSGTFLASIDSVRRSPLKPYREQTVSRPLMSRMPKSGYVTARSYISSLGVTKWTLSNGATVLLKPTQFRNNEIQMLAWSEGGTSLVRNHDDRAGLISAAFASSAIPNNGVAAFSRDDLSRFLAGKVVSVSPYISTYEEGLRASSSINDAETMFQLAHLRFTSPRKDKKAFGAWTDELRTSLANRESDPDVTFSDSVSLTLSSHSPRTILLRPSVADSVSQQKAFRFYRSRFANAADFTFAIVGSFSLDSIEPLVCRYIASLPASRSRESWIDNGVRPPKGSFTNRFSAHMTTSKTSVHLFQWTGIPPALDNRLSLAALKDILFMRYVSLLREEEGGTYGAHVSTSLSDRPWEQASLSVSFHTDPLSEQRLVDIAWSQLDSIAANGPTDDEVRHFRTQMHSAFLENVKDNAWWLSTIRMFDAEGIDRFSRFPERLDAVTPASVQALTRALLFGRNRTQVIMVPKP